VIFRPASDAGNIHGSVRSFARSSIENVPDKRRYGGNLYATTAAVATIQLLTVLFIGARLDMLHAFPIASVI
jgi:hypothetical protein